jgi:hypothetical protein
MEITTTTIERSNGRRAAINTLAVVGFIALIIIGIVLAIYSARYIPKAFNRIGAAAVSLSQTFRPAQTPASLEVVATTTLPIAAPSTASTSATAVTTTEAAVIASIKPAHTTAGTKTSGTYTTVPVSVPAAALYGKPDLTVSITDIGYLTGASNDTFISSPTIPAGSHGAVKFVISNIGTNASGQFSFNAAIPTAPSFTFTSPFQQSLLPNDRIEYTLGFDQTYSGGIRTITILVDNTNVVDESSELNNSQSRAVSVN